MLKKSQRGEVSIRILGLNSHGLPDARRARYEAVRTKAAYLASALAGPIPVGPKVQDLVQDLLSEVRGKGEYTAVVRVAIADANRELGILGALGT
jgi:hypothetical protein